MQCPNDGTTLEMTSREGVEIDYCPKCRGVWLDRGELDKLIERSDQAYGRHAPHTSAPIPGQEYFKPDEDSRPRFEGPNYRDPGHTYDEYGHGHNQHKRHKKESFLSDMFDF
ncbi:MAG TPA: zf-TFIIB domain-containing protein [Candidatus Limnocylindrales bacterium]|nr:zf-TFIIB domain-containing protein [Candidatus Limnocylindrales bacterium]